MATEAQPLATGFVGNNKASDSTHTPLQKDTTPVATTAAANADSNFSKDVEPVPSFSV